jgi:hypothetical protein
MPLLGYHRRGVRGQLCSNVVERRDRVVDVGAVSVRTQRRMMGSGSNRSTSSTPAVSKTSRLRISRGQIDPLTRCSAPVAATDT